MIIKHKYPIISILINPVFRETIKINNVWITHIKGINRNSELIYKTQLIISQKDPTTISPINLFYISDIVLEYSSFNDFNVLFNDLEDFVRFSEVDDINSFHTSTPCIWNIRISKHRSTLHNIIESSVWINHITDCPIRMVSKLKNKKSILSLVQLC